MSGMEEGLSQVGRRIRNRFRMLGWDFRSFAFFLLLACVLPGVSAAADAIDSGDTAWMLTSTALVLYYDDSGSGPLLRRVGSVEECALRPDAMPCFDGPDDCDLVRGWI